MTNKCKVCNSLMRRYDLFTSFYYECEACIERSRLSGTPTETITIGNPNENLFDDFDLAAEFDRLTKGIP